MLFYKLFLATAETKIKRRSSEKALSLQTDKLLEPARPLRNKPLTPDPGGPKNVEKAKNDLSSNVFKIIKKNPAPSKPKTPDSILPPTLKPKLSEKVKLKREKYVNNNTVWTNANVVKSEKHIPIVSIRYVCTIYLIILLQILLTLMLIIIIIYFFYLLNS